ncbi:MAG TPA: Uma2 family endonuclease [Gemmataceae bacterium]|nr:Uma2 family endonuclease [Gemmataceae bacterium]
MRPQIEAARRTRKSKAVLPSRMIILDEDYVQRMIRERQKLGIDRYDEVWDGVYVMPPLANNPHQETVGFLTPIYHEVAPPGSRVFPGANVSDRREDWEKNFRCPDVVVVLPDSLAVDCGTHWLGGPDFLTEIKSPVDDTEEKIPFYSQVKVRELLIIERDSRALRLLRHDGRELVDVPPTPFKGKPWFVSEVLPLAFRQLVHQGQARMEIRRTDKGSGKWIV